MGCFDFFFSGKMPKWTFQCKTFAVWTNEKHSESLELSRYVPFLSLTSITPHLIFFFKLEPPHSQCHLPLRYSMPTLFCLIWYAFTFILDSSYEAELHVYRTVLSRTRPQQLKLLGAESRRKLGRTLNTSFRLPMANVLPTASPTSNHT